MPLTSRSPLLVLLLAVLTACASTPMQPADSATSPSADRSDSTSNSAFPFTIEHKYGSTDITEPPERIVTVGLTEQDALLALGIVPVGTTEWFGAYPGAVWPWAADELGDAEPPEVVGDASTLNFEAITALQPDVILALYSGVTEEQYATLTAIAPTVAQPAEYVDYGIPWEELTRTVGQVVGKAAETEDLIAAIDDRFALARSGHPEFAGSGGRQSRRQPRIA